jgi:hypothetical protein
MGWLNKRRIRVYPVIFLVVYVCLYIYMVSSGSGLLDAFGNPIGSDFLAFWSISKVIITEEPKEVYNREKMYEVQKNTIGVYSPYPTFYPPSSLIFIAPLALLPYIPSLILWLVITLALYLFVLWRIAPNAATLWLGLAFPGTYQNFIHGQNGFLVVTLLGGGLMFMDRSPVIAGVFFGLSIFKPHLAILIPIALLAHKNWKVLASMVLTGISIVLISLIVFGYDSWRAFFESFPYAMEIIESGEARLYQLTSVMAMTVLLGPNILTAKITHLVFAIVALGLVAWVWYKKAPLFLRASSLALGTLLIPPYVHIYDLAILALPIAWMGWETFRTGNRLRGLEYLLVITWVAPLLANVIAKETKIQFAPILIFALLLHCFYWASELKKKPLQPKSSLPFSGLGEGEVRREKD